MTSHEAMLSYRSHEWERLSKESQTTEQSNNTNNRTVKQSNSQTAEQSNNRTVGKKREKIAKFVCGTISIDNALAFCAKVAQKGVRRPAVRVADELGQDNTRGWEATSALLVFYSTNCLDLIVSQGSFTACIATDSQGFTYYYSTSVQ